MCIRDRILTWIRIPCSRLPWAAGATATVLLRPEAVRRFSSEVPCRPGSVSPAEGATTHDVLDGEPNNDDCSAARRLRELHLAARSWPGAVRGGRRLQSLWREPCLPDRRVRRP